MKRVCTACGETVEYKDLAKAYESEDGRVVVMTDEDFADLPVPGIRDIDVLEFVPREQVDPILFDRSYYLEPDGRSVKPYVLLREALQQTERTAIVKVVLRTKQQLAALRVRDDVLVLQTMLWPDEVRAAEFDTLAGDVEIRPQELAMAESLIDNLSADFDPGMYHDEYREALTAVIEAKLAGGTDVQEPVVVAGDEGATSVVDLMTALRESVERTKAARGGARSPAASAASAAEPAAPAEAPTEEAAPATRPARRRRTA
jgi:DNA end-binding protein Ku